MNILVRLPNWLGDMVMSTGFLQALRSHYPGSATDVIVKKGLDSMLDHIPGTGERYVFSREEWKGSGGAWRFGRRIRIQKKYDLFFCLPDSFSSAAMALGTGAKERIGFKKEMRSFLLTRSYGKPSSLHRVEEYIFLLQQFSKREITIRTPRLERKTIGLKNRVILNFNSEAVSRRMPLDKAVSILNKLIRELPAAEFVCIGTEKDKSHMDSIIQKADPSGSIIDETGKTKNPGELIRLIGTGTVMLSTDSGPAHIANAIAVPTVVLFGAGNEKNTAPYDKEYRTVLRLGQLPCEPCVKNTCQFGLPKCLEQLEEQKIITAVKRYLSPAGNDGF